MRLSVVIAARNAAATLNECFDALEVQDPRPIEVIVVDDASSDTTAAVAASRGARVVRNTTRRWVAGARNVGAEVSTGDVVAFVDADDVVVPGWSQALAGQFAAGADIVRYENVADPAGSIASRYAQERRPPGVGSDPKASGPWPAGGVFAIRRSAFAALGGFDATLHSSEDGEFFLRAAVAGLAAPVAPGAGYLWRRRPTVVGLIRQRARWFYWSGIVRHRYRQFPFAFVPPQRVAWRIATAVAAAAFRAGAGDPAGAEVELLEAVMLVVERSASAVARVDIWVRRRPSLVPPTVGSARWSRPLPPGPRAILVGDGRAVAKLARAATADRRVAVAPPGLLPATAEAWAAPAPRSASLVRVANRNGWHLPRALAAARLDEAAAVDAGDAALALHGVHAWLTRKPTWVLAAPGTRGPVAVARLRSVPVVAVGGSPPLGRDVEVAVSVRDLDEDPVGTLRRLSPVLGLGSVDEVATVLRGLTRLRYPWARSRR